MEFQKIVSHINRLKKRILYKKLVATTKNFEETLKDQPIALHFSGHGVRESEDSSHLIFENAEGKVEKVSLEDMKTMLSKQIVPIKFIFISACHSEKIGILFYQAGVKHVICIRHKMPVIDHASIAFTKEFYRLAFGEG